MYNRIVVNCHLNFKSDRRGTDSKLYTVWKYSKCSHFALYRTSLQRQCHRVTVNITTSERICVNIRHTVKVTRRLLL